MKELWVFTSKEKLEKFAAILAEQGIGFELGASGKNKFPIEVDEADYAKAKRMLLKHRERRTSGDLL